MSSGSDFNIGTGPSGTFISIDSTRIDACMRLFQEQSMSAIHISSLGSFKAKDLEFLRTYADIVHEVLISDGSSIDVSALECLIRLDSLTLHDFGKPVRLPLLKGLKKFAGLWSPLLELGPGCRELERIALWSFKGKSLHEFPLLPELRELDLVQASLQSLAGLEQLKEPEKLILHRCIRLEDLSALTQLSGGTLQSVSLERCRKIQSYEPLSSLSRISHLNIQYCSDLPNLNFLEGCHELSAFGFYGTKLLTDDVSPLMRLPKLTFVGFSGQRNLRQQRKEIAEFLDAKKQA